MSRESGYLFQQETLERCRLGEDEGEVEDVVLAWRGGEGWRIEQRYFRGDCRLNYRQEKTYLQR
jgi:hypothetical protein